LQTFRPRRSVLYVPGANQRALDKARELDADGLIFDLEDSAAPGAKQRAREQVRRALLAGNFGTRELVVRINGLDTPWGEADLAAVAQLAIDAVLLPKVDAPSQLAAVTARLKVAGAPPELMLWAMIETPRGVLAVGAIAATPRLRCLVVGAEDLAAALRVPPSNLRDGLGAALERTVLAARAHGLDVLDGVHTNLNDDDGLRAQCAQGRALGFDGKTLIHPGQIAAANQAFTPDPEAVARARAIVAAGARAERRGDGVTVLDGRLVERLHVTEARRILALAAAARTEPDTRRS